MATTLRDLYESLDRRLRPEEVAALVRAVLPHPTAGEARWLHRVARHAFAPSFMSADFRRVVGMERQLGRAATFVPQAVPDGLDLLRIERFIRTFESAIGMAPGRSDFKYDRLNREQRAAAGLGGISRRRYNKLFRLAGRLNAKRAKISLELEKRSFTQMSKSRLASRIRYEDFVADASTACFVAYYAARCNLRTIFTNQAQDRPFDELCNLLLQRLHRAPDQTRWLPVAMVYPDPVVLQHLTDQEKGELMGYWYQALTRLAQLLSDVWFRSRINRRTMIVHRGNDSSTWNVLAGAWNKARDAWINLLYDLGAEPVLEAQCPGKVLRLMAADVAWWHQATGGGLDRDTAVWSEVPLPWEVFQGAASCTRAEVESACARHGLNPIASGWTGPKPPAKIQAFRPTPELVHGVVVASPKLAQILRKAGVFSGQSARPNASDFADEIATARQAHWNAQGPLAKGALEQRLDDPG